MNVSSNKIKLSSGGNETFASLYKNPTVTSLMELLPIKMSVLDFHGKKKVSEILLNLSIERSVAGSTPQRGDIAYYAPKGKLAFFQQNYRYSNGLIVIGKMDLTTNFSISSGYELNIELVSE